MSKFLTTVIVDPGSEFTFSATDIFEMQEVGPDRPAIKCLGTAKVDIYGELSCVYYTVQSLGDLDMFVHDSGKLTTNYYDSMIFSENYINFVNEGQIYGRIKLGREGGLIDNRGQILSVGYGVAISNTNSTDAVINSGSIDTSQDSESCAIAINTSSYENGNFVYIKNIGKLSGGMYGIRQFDNSQFANVKIDNFGNISGSSYAYKAALYGVDVINNAGVMNGGVNLERGDDSYFGIGNGYVSGIVDAGAGNDILVGSQSNDNFFGGEGNDRLQGGGGDDSLDGGGGNDTADYGGSTAAVTVDLGIKIAQDTKGAGIDTLNRIENLTGSSFADTLTGNGLANVLSGADGADLLTGNAGGDLLIGGAGADKMFGGSGNDTYFVDDAGDRVYETATALSTDTVDLGGVDGVTSTIGFILGKYVENLTLAGTASINGTGNDLANQIVGNDSSNALDGGAGADTLKGGGGNDKLNGGSGADKMFGGSGNDTYFVDNAGDRAYETGSAAVDDMIDLGGTDTVNSSVNYELGKYIENLRLTGGANLSGTGNDRANTLVGNDGANLLKGLAGNDTLVGGPGNDKLYGGEGKDALTGGEGRDYFVFDTAPASRDTITDFRHVDGDKIQLSHQIFTGIAYTSTLHADDFYAAAGATKAHDATDRIVYNTTTGVLYYDADGVGGAAAVQIAQIGVSSHPALAYGDFQIIT